VASEAVVTDLAVQTRQAAAREVTAALSECRAVLESYVEQTGNRALLEQCIRELHQARGALQLLEIHGAALLAEEMEQVGRYLLGSSSEARKQAEALDALMRAVVQLPVYLERVLAGGRDMALVLLPLLNDLRAVRGSALLSEGTLLLLNLRSDRKPLARKSASGLVGWIRSEEPDDNLDTLASVSLRMEQVARSQPVFQLWWVVGALIEALRDGGVEPSVAVKRLLGLADRELRRLYELGETKYAAQPPVELLNNLLYYVARATSDGPQVQAVRESFRLNELLPVDEEVERERDSLSAPSVKLMHTVADAIREDLGKLKEVLDLYMRRGGRQVDELKPQLEVLRKLGDTLGVLGLGQLRSRIQEAHRLLEGMVTGRGGASANAVQLTDVAAILIKVDDNLDEHLVGQILPRVPAAEDAARAEDGHGEPDVDFRQVQAALLRECAVNLMRIKDAVAQNVNGSLDTAAVDNWPELLRGIKAGLLMLGRQRAAEMLDQIGTQLKRVMLPGGTTLSGVYLDRLADAIVSVEYYIETVQAGRSDPWYMLDNAQRCIEFLVSDRGSPVPTVSALPAGVAEEAQGGVSKDVPAGAAPHPYAATLVLARPPVLPPARAEAASARSLPPADPELMRLYAEEAREEQVRIQKFFGAWDANPAESSALETVRRAFHTLKGSGRMVGERSIAEFSWAVENLLNRLLDGTLMRSPAIMAVLRAAVERLPALVGEIGQSGPVEVDVSALVTEAHALAAGREVRASEEEPAPAVTPAAAAPAAMRVETAVKPLVAAAPPTALPVSEPKAAPAPEPAPADESLRQIYMRETDAHVVTVRAWVAAERQQSSPHVVPEAVFRACHTLSGSSQMAEARHGIRLTEPLNLWLRKAFDSGIGLDDSDLQLLDECMAAMRSVAANLDESTGYFVVHETLRARLARADASLVRRIDEATAAVPTGTLPPEVPPAVVKRDYDSDVATIFVEEATELLEAAQSAMQVWSAGFRVDDIDALKRPLHTLKGGARMAGISAMGDLAHEFESLVELLQSGVVTADADARGLAQRTLDELARMHEMVSAGLGVAPATALLAELRRRARGPAAVAPAAVFVPAAAAAPPDDTIMVRALEPPAAVPQPPASPPPVSAPAEVEILAAALAPPVVSPIALPMAPPMAPAAVPPGREPVATAERGEMARVSAELLDQLLNHAGEVSISRARLEQQLAAVEFNLGELSRTVTRLKEQLRKLEIETEAQILHRHGDESARRSDFDPLELDRYSAIQQYSRALSESTSDVASLQQLLETLVADAQNQLQQQSRVVGELQNGLMHTRMVTFQRHVQRLTRIVRQAGNDSGREAELVVEGASGELDRQVLERMLPPLEHMLRNAVVHGIETPAARRTAGKAAAGMIHLQLRREGSEVVIELRDDGAGMNLEAIRSKGLALGLIGADQQLADDDVMQLVLEPGFSTANAVTQQAGRGVGMDVVATEIKNLGGALHMQSTRGQGTHFTIRLPLTLAISHALIVRTGNEYYALPLPTIEGVVRLAREEVAAQLRSEAPTLQHGQQRYRLQPLSVFIGLEAAPLPPGDAAVPVVLVRAGEHSTGLVADELIGSREIVVKPVGPLLASIRGISGATILSDGKVVVILDAGALLRAGARGRHMPLAPRERVDTRTLVMVVDDSITVRRVTQRLLERNGMRVVTARDGMDALAVLAENQPDVLLLDIEMPRMDGYEVAAHVRSDPKLRSLPIIMITSRVGDKHRARAIELGVNDYLGKPYQEDQLLAAIAHLVDKKPRSLAGKSS
jgi:chemosensory pili system protein ChpA (sensor histidine kinase/response regulator)